MTDAREPAFNAPWPPLLLSALIVGLYAVQARTGGAAWAAPYGLTEQALTPQGWPRLFTHMGVHAGWLHAGMNAVFLLALGAPLARRFGTDARGGLYFIGFTVICGLIAAVVWLASVWGQNATAIGASGAVFGVVGASARLLGSNFGVAPILDRRALGFAGAWLVASVVTGLIGYSPTGGTQSVAVVAHVGGLIAGYILVGPAARLFPPPPAPPEPAHAPGPWDV